ncbi:hypothetical protein [Crocosphaera sp. Alani8]|uniref:hypothetical protein n=1 Tax=Crocosphaera sp. Alani8 TaxID=3038952 RepID=UPI00313B1C92
MFSTGDRLIVKTFKGIISFLSSLKESPTGLCFFLLTIASTPMSLAQTTSNRELPPPPLPKMVNSESPVNRVIPTVETSTPIKEYTFSAPQTIPAQTLDGDPPISESQTINTQPNQNASFYRVEVAGKNISLLSQVKTVEPMAFIRQSEGVIHAGVFQNSQQAQKRVEDLNSKGLSATVVSVYRQRRTSLSVQTKP